MRSYRYIANVALVTYHIDVLEDNYGLSFGLDVFVNCTW